MDKIMKVYIVNAFTSRRFGGNPAAVVPLDVWLEEEQMQLMAAQHNLSETAFFVSHDGDFTIRWFTPSLEVDLCGHATLAAAHVLFHHLRYDRPEITFHSKSGPLGVSIQANGRLTLDFPSLAVEPTEIAETLTRGLKATILEAYRSRFDYLLLLNKQADVEALEPDFAVLKSLPARGVIVTAPGEESDFVSRCFYPQAGINEDPVTGSAHSVLAPFWAHRLGKNTLTAIQLSSRKGWLECSYQGDRTLIGGYALTYLVGDIVL
jgi:PhzF family phenazine biosynthesis protein